VNSFVDKVGDQDPKKYGKGRVNANNAAFFIGIAPEHTL
jgi:hypothetical protein